MIPNCPCTCHAGKGLHEIDSPIPLLYHRDNCCWCHVSFEDRVRINEDDLKVILVKYGKN